MPSAGNEGKAKLSETEVITTVKEIRLQPQGFEMTKTVPSSRLVYEMVGLLFAWRFCRSFGFFSLVVFQPFHTPLVGKMLDLEV